MRDFQLSGFLYILILAIIALSTNQCGNGTDTKIPPLEEGYKPDQPIEFPHDIHVNKGIDCKYCHNPQVDGKKAGIPSEKVCMKCHKQIKENP